MLLLPIALLHASLGCMPGRCSCGRALTVGTRAEAAAALRDADAAFVARVVAVEEVVRSSRVPGASGTSRLVPWGKRDVQLRVEHRFKGARPRTGPDTLTVRTGTGGGDCGVGYEVGARFLVYIRDAAPAARPYHSSWCDGTKPVEGAEREIALLREASRRADRGA